MKKALIISLVASSGLIASALIIAKPWITIRQAKPIMVKGYAEAEVEADSGSLSATVVESAASNAEAYLAAGEALKRMKAIASKVLGNNLEMVELKTSVSETLKLNEQGKKTNEVDYYVVTRRIRINSGNVQGLEKLGRALFDLNGEGLRISVTGPNFFVSDLDRIKLELIEKATQNGKERAQLMADSSGEKLGSLVSARQGVIQITKKNSAETASWGVYDTETIDKVVKLVVTLEYEIAK